MAQLYTVTVEVDLQVWAENEQEAEDIGRRSIRDELEYAVIVATPTTSLPEAWKDAIPYGVEHNETCEMLIREKYPDLNEAQGR